MIIDAHVHAGKGDLLTAPWNTSAPIEPYLRRAAAAGIDHSIIFAPFHSDYAVANRQTAQIVARYPQRLVGFAFINTRADAGRILDLVRQAVTRLGFRGIKLHGSEGMPTRELCEAAQAFNLPVIVDVVGRGSTVEMFASEYPGVNFIIPHFGSFSDDWRAQQQVVDQIVRFPNVYTDTSGVRRFDYILQGVRRAGAHKILFGSDGPWLHPGLELYKIRLLRLPADQEKLILGGNALRLLGQVRASRSPANPNPSAVPAQAIPRPNGKPH
jgi:predicted TIM-barrel fold metal-dependent hydrolase